MKGESEIPPQVENIGAANPIAIANLVLDRKIDWTNVQKPRLLLEQTLGMPYEDLFDPAGGSPLYPGAELDSDGELHWEPVNLNGMVEDLRMDNDLDVSELNTINEIEERVNVSDFFDQQLLNISLVSPQRLLIEIPTQDTDEPLQALPMPVREMLVTPTDWTESSNDDWEPDYVDWRDVGDFFEEATEYNDPMQGAVGDCYLIAALAAVAWSRPYDIQARNRKVLSESNPINMIEFHDGQDTLQIEVTQDIPVTETGNSIIYAQSRDAGEVWPAIYEKAYAKWKTGRDSNKPPIPNIAGGDMVRASAELTGLDPEYYSTRSRSGDELWTILRSNSRGGRTFNPMTAWTYSTSSNAPDNIDYTNINIVANHAYSVINAAYDSQTKTKYMVLYNPWGVYEPPSDLSGAWSIYDYVGDKWDWRWMDLQPNDGLFAIDVDKFKRYYAGLGVVK